VLLKQIREIVEKYDENMKFLLTGECNEDKIPDK